MSNNDTSRILAIDDDPIILALYRKVFEENQKDIDSKSMLSSLESLLDFGEESGSDSSSNEQFSLTFSSQGLEGVEAAREALSQNRPYSVAFIDMRMPPGIDGLETAKLLRELDERIGIVFVTAFSDRGLEEISEFSQQNVLYIQKPFNKEEILLAANTMTRNWINDNVRKVEALFKAKSDFLATMSHELRTPLSAIIGNSEYLAGQLRDDEQLQVVQSIQSAGKHQLALVNDILDISKIESGKFSVDDAPYDLGKLLNNLRQMLSVNAQDAGVEFTLAQKNEEPYQLMGDDQRIGQILINLLSNAFKFTHEGSVSLEVWRDDEGLHFEVRDSGIGMSEETVDRLFGRFEQADGSISRQFGGTGLGLYISLNLAQLMGGTIEVSSVLGEGSTFRLVLPYRPSEEPAAQLQSTQQESDTPGVKELLTGEVLIVEDTPALMSLERRSVEQLGATVTPAYNGKEAVELAASTRFDLILMDMQMPEMDGIEATRILRERGDETPVIMISANVMQEHREAFEQVGSNGFLAKPFYSEELRKIIKPYLTVVEMEEEGEVSLPEVDGATETESSGVEGRRRPPGELDDMVNDEILGQFYENLVGTRGSLELALQEADWQQVREVSHVIKGYGIPFGYPAMSRLGMAVNESAKRGEENPALVEALLSYLQEIIDCG